MIALLVLGLLLWAAPAAQAHNFTHPGPVTSLAPNPGNQSITVTWEPPASDGGSPITSYTVECAPANQPTWHSEGTNGSSRSYTFTKCHNHNPLINGTTYRVRVKANNYWSNGTDIGAPILQINAGAPATPTLTATAGDHQVALSWPTGNGNGAAITEWEYQQDGGSWTDIPNSGASTTSYTVTGLTNGTEYTFGVRAVNSRGNGGVGAKKATPVGPPEKPTVTATDGDQQVTLNWTGPSNNGGSAITEWEYQQDGGSWTDISGSGASTTSHTVTGLTNGTAYTFKVRAVNTHGDGAESDAVTATPATTPAAPTGLSATDGNRQVTLSWTAPTSTGGANITRYKYSKDDGATYTATGATTTSYTVTGLTNGTGYTFKVRAVNRKGDGAESTAATATPATTPAAPTGLTATPDSQTARQMRLSWTAPTNTGGANIIRYEYSKDNGSTWTSTGATTTSYTVTTGLTNGTGYPFKVRAVNRKGAGTPSAAATATTTTTPAAPTGLSATDDNQAAGAVALSWTAPTSTGGLAITGYKYSTNNGSSWTATGSTNTSKTVTNLTNGTAYTFKVRAVNNAGDGTASAAVTATPSTTPAKPTLTVVTSNEQVRLVGNSGGRGAPITRWEYRQKDTGAYGAWMPIQNSNTNTLSALVTGLENGTAYTFQVQAVNKKGSGADSDEATATPRGFTATAGNQSVTLNWNALPANANIEKWEYQHNGTWTEIPNSATSTRSSTVTGLENGTAYTFQVRGLDGSNNPVEQIEFPSATPQQPAPQDQTGFGGSSGGDDTADQHGDTAAEATSVGVDSSMPGEMNSSTDQDYFTIDVPQAGLLVVETIGSVDTRGRLMTPDGQMLAQADSGGTRQNFQLTQRVTAGDYLVVVTGRGTGSYRLEVDLLVGFVDNPQPDSAQSGIGVLSGWVCEAETVEFELNGALQQAAYGTERTDTADHCGDTNNGFGLLYNWNRLGDGDHTVRVLVDGIEFASQPVTVTTLGLGDEFPTGLTGEATLVDFPADGESVRLVWQEAQQNFALAEGASIRQGSTRDPDWAFLENTAPGSYQSGIRVLSGWVCEAEEVVLEIDGVHRLVAAYGTERTDTEDKCGDTDNGFGLLWNWNKLADGSHTIRLLVDGEEWATATFTVTTLGAEMRWGLAYTGTVADFPTPGQAVTVEWQEAQQNFVITGVE